MNDDTEQPLRNVGGLGYPDECKMCQGGSSTNRPDGTNNAFQGLCCFDGQPLTKLGQEISFFGSGKTLETKCPQCTQNPSAPHLIDGCSAPVPNAQDPMQNGLYIFGLLNVAPTSFGQAFSDSGQSDGVHSRRRQRRPPGLQPARHLLSELRRARRRHVLGATVLRPGDAVTHEQHLRRRLSGDVSRQLVAASVR